MWALGRNIPPDFDHVAKHPLAAVSLPGALPVTLACNWYEDFDAPIRREDGSFHLPEAKAIRGSIRGGHCVCLQPMGAVKHNTAALWEWFNQKREGACVGFSHARALQMDRGRLLDGFDLYNAARGLEGAPTQEGTTSRSVCEVLRTQGAREQLGTEACQEGLVGDTLDQPDRGIVSYHWATTVDEVALALGRTQADAFPFVNSWGTSFPQVCWLPASTLERLLGEEGECGVMVAR